MSDAQRLTGRCLCGAVTITAQPTSRHLDACHCTMCRRWGGGALIVAQCTDDADVGGASSITTYDSSEWAERAFCNRCGTHLYYRLKAGGLLAIPVGLLDSDGNWQLVQEIFVDEKPTYYDFANATERLTGAEVIARFGAP